MANFMGPMAPPQAAPQTPPQMDVRTTAGQRAQFKNFMSGMGMPQMLPNIGMGVPPEQPSFAPMPQIPTPMMGVDIFQPQSFYAGGPVDAAARGRESMGRDLGYGEFGQGTLDSSSPRLERNDALSDILTAAPVPAPEPVYSMPNPMGMALESIQPSLPSPVQGIMNAANNAMGAVKRGVTMSGPGGLGSFNIRPVIQQSGLGLPSLEGFDANYTLNFEDGGPVHMQFGGDAAERAREERGLDAGFGERGTAGGFSRDDRNDRNDSDNQPRDLTEVAEVALERRVDAPPAFGITSAAAKDELARRAGIERRAAAALVGGDPTTTGFGPPTVDRSAQMGGFFDDLGDRGDNLNEPGIFGVAGSEYDIDGTGQGFENATQIGDFFDDIMRVPMMLQKTPSFMGQGLGRTILSPESFKQAAIDFLDQPGAVFDPETGVLTRPEGQGTMTMNRFGNVTYSGPRSSDPFRDVAIGERDAPIDVMQPVSASEVDPCPPGYELRGGVCQPVAPNQIGGTATTPAATPTPAPSVVVASPRPAVGPLQGPASYQGPATFDQGAMLTPEFFQNLLAPRAVGMQMGGEVLDKAAGQFLEALQAA